MEKSFLLRSFFFILLILFFLSILNILFYIPFQPISWDFHIIEVIWGAGIQSIISSSLTLILALIGAFGYIALSQNLKLKQRVFLHVSIILPCFLPPLVVIILGSQAIGTYLTGLWGIVFFHVLMNVGIIGVLLAQIIQKKAEAWAQLCSVESVGPIRFILRGLLPEIKSDLNLLFTFLFILYFLSFSIPLLVGDIRYSGLEVFIYEKIFLFGHWHEAVQYSVVFIMILFGISYFFERKSVQPTQYEAKVYGLLNFSHSSLVTFLLLPTLLLCSGFALSLFQLGYSAFHFNGQQVRGTMLVGLLTGFVVFIVLSMIGYCYNNDRLSKWIFAFVSPSWAVVGFSFFLLGSNSALWAFIKIGFALTLLYVPYLFRLSYFNKLNELRSQVDVALIGGAHWNKIYFQIIWPQVLPMICFLSGIAALWACGDFALSGMLLGEDMTLALQMKSLMMNYRLEQALLLLVPLILVSVIIYLIFQGLSYVCRRSLLS